MNLVFFIIGLIGWIIAIILTISKAIKKEPRKGMGKFSVAFFILMIIGLLMSGIDFIETDKYLEENTVLLSEGEYLTGEDIVEGIYDVTFSGIGNFIVYDIDDSLLTNEMVSDSLGINRYRAILPKDSRIELHAIEATFVPALVMENSYEKIEIYSGYWIIGLDIREGTYTMRSEDIGYLLIYSSEGDLKTDTFFSGDDGVYETIVDLEEDELLEISGLDKVTLIPKD